MSRRIQEVDSVRKALLALSAGAVLMACQQQSAQQQEREPLKLETEDQKVAYSLGANTGERLTASLAEIEKLGVPLDKEIVARGFEDAFTDEVQLQREEMQQMLMSFSQKAQQLAMANQQQEAEENLATGEAFLAENAKKEGVIVLDSGLQYKVVSAGGEGGSKPALSDRVVVHYAGRLIDGTEFDSSYHRGEPAQFGVGQVIQGWTEALQLMQKGDKWQLYIPAELAYGDTSNGRIPANSVLIFDVELLDILPVTKKD